MQFPNLSDVKKISMDIETHDPSIREGLGSGARRADCYILGVGIGTVDKQWYFPVNHKNISEGDLFSKSEEIKNIPLEQLAAWLKSIKHIPAVFAKALYDLDFTQYLDFIPDDIHDIQISDPLLNEDHDSYSLDAQAVRWLGERKQEQELINWCAANGFKGAPQGHLAKMPFSLVAKYCKNDCRQTYAIHELHMPKIIDERLTTVYDLERALIPALLKMKRTGVRVDVDKLDFLTEKYSAMEKESAHILKDKYFIALSEKGTVTPTELKLAFKRFGLKYKTNEKGNPMFDKESLMQYGGDLCKAVIKHRYIKSLLSTHINGLRPYIINGRVHPEFIPLRCSTAWGDEKGTGIGRFSCVNPNLHSSPNSDEEDADAGELIRSCFLPEKGCEWGKLDYSQMEMYSALHWACGEGADNIRSKVINNPTIDFYAMLASIYHGRKIEKGMPERDKFKTITLATLYEEKAERLGRTLGIITKEKPYGVTGKYWQAVFDEEIKDLTWDERMQAGYENCGIDIDEYAYLDQYLEAWKLHNKIGKIFPWMKKTSEKARETVREQKYIRTILGRKRRYRIPYNCPGVCKRCDVVCPSYKAFHDCNCGSCADIIKVAMLKAYQKGLMDVLPMHLTIHDELDVSVKPGDEEALNELKNTMETAIKLRVPLKVKVLRGKNWGEVE